MLSARTVTLRSTLAAFALLVAAVPARAQSGSWGNPAGGVQEDGPQAGIGRQQPRAPLDLAREVRRVGEPETAAREADRGSEDAGKGQVAEAAVECDQAGDLARHADRETA